MKNKTYMLPYRFRKCGYGLIIASVLSLVLGLLMANVWEIIPQTHTRFISMVMYLLFFLGIFVIVMTEEKDEDEMLMSIRRRSISLSAFITFALYIAMSSVVAFVHGFRSLDCTEIYKIHEMISNIMTPFLIYLVIFRVSVWKMRDECKEDQA
jgi:hypothetical protein